MKERLIQLLDLEQLSPSKFADIIGVQRSSVSHVISGRNNPSFDFLQKTLTAFPGLNAEWLILGKGTMYEQMGRPPVANLFDTPAREGSELTEEEVIPPESGEEPREETPLHIRQETPYHASAGKNEASEKEYGQRRISRVILIYDNDTFTSFDPS
jgi:transcriptional regulator with XRE-family HTH domain